MGVREYDYIRGNTVLAPERKRKEQEKIKEKLKREQERRAHKRRQKILLSSIGAVALMFTLATTSLFLKSKVYGLQKELLILEQNLKEEQDVNAAINVEMLKFASFDKIKSTAEGELGMIYPNSESTITIDMSKEYFSHIKTEGKNKNKLLEKIIAAFN